MNDFLHNLKLGGPFWSGLVGSIVLFVFIIHFLEKNESARIFYSIAFAVVGSWVVGIAVQFIYEVVKASRNWTVRTRHLLFAAVIVVYIAAAVYIMYNASFSAKYWIKIVIFGCLGLIVAVMLFIENQAKKNEPPGNRKQHEEKRKTRDS